MNITAQLLEDNGFEEDYEVYKIFDWVEMERVVDDKYFVRACSVSNTPGRNWAIHVDNTDHDTVGSVDIKTVAHFNAFMELLDIKFRLKDGNEEKR